MTLRNDILRINVEPRMPRGRMLVLLAITCVIVVMQFFVDPQRSTTHKIIDNHFSRTESNIGLKAIYDDDALFMQEDKFDIDAFLLKKNINGTAAHVKNSIEIVEKQDGESIGDDFAIESDNDPQDIMNTNTNTGTTTIMDESKPFLPQLQTTDVIFDPSRWGNPIIIEEFKLAFFTIPKVACTQWKLLFRRMEGFPDWDPTKKLISLHRPTENGLTYLSDYSLEKAQEILISNEWTKAVFVREPKERIVSAFLDKFVSNAYFCDLCLPLNASIEERQNCRYQGRDKRNFTYFLQRAVKCSNMHWNPQAYAIDAKWWPLMDFVGYMDSVATDTKQLLQSIHSQSTGKNAWDLHGKTGWGVNGTRAFMQKNNAPHARSAHDKIREYYSKCTEDFVERYWEVEWTHGTYHFDRFRLANDTVDEECDLQ